VLTDRGRVLGTAYDMKGDPQVAKVVKDPHGSTAADDNGVVVLLPVETDRGVAVVRTAVTEADLRRGVYPAWAGIIGLGLLLLAISWVIAARLGRRISEPLLDVAAVAHRLREGDLSARAEVAGTAETAELGRALNGLAERTAELLAAERAVVADLSHRLRTPVTALRLDAEGVEDHELMLRLQQHIAVLQRTIDAIVSDARRPVISTMSARCDAASTVRDRVAFWHALAEDAGREMSVQIDPGPLPVAVSAEDLAAVVDVLVDNVFAHTPEGTPFTVRLSARDGVRLVVSDSGTGATEQPGTGLGLDIARRTASAGGGSLRVGSTPAGTMVEVDLPLHPE
jgi:signal transduction histidine kinase